MVDLGMRDGMLGAWVDSDELELESQSDSAGLPL